MSRTHRLFGAASLSLAVLALVAPGVRAADDPIPIEQGHTDLVTLEQQMKKGKTPNEDILGSLDAVFKAYKNPKDLDPVADDASEDVKKAHAAAVEKHKKDVATFRKKSEKAFVDALTLQRINKNTKSNEREDVNIKGAVLLGETGNPDLSNDIMKAIETRLANARDYTVSTGLWEAAFAALGKLGSEKSLAWIQENYTHAKSSPPEVVDQLVAAHKAIPLFKEISGKLRLSLVDQMLRTYSGTESQAEQSSNDPKKQSAKVFWDRIKTDSIKAVQYLAREPANAEGQALATMKDFLDWFRDNDNPKKAPWIEPKEDPKEEPKPEAPKAP